MKKAFAFLILLLSEQKETKENSFILETSYLHNFTLVELLAVIGITAILAGLLLPVLGQVRERGKSSVCLNNVRTVSMGIMNYIDSFNDFLPGRSLGRGQYWHITFAKLKLVDTVMPAPNVNDGKARGVYACPSMGYNVLGNFNQELRWNIWNTYKACSYGLNRYLCRANTAEDRAPGVWRKITAAKTPSRTYTAGDKWMADRPGSAAPQQFIRARYYQPGERHSGRWNVAMLDGHAITAKGYPCKGESSDFNAPEWSVY